VTTTGAVHRYHDGTKHHFNRFARSLGYLDWASQPNPFRSFDGAPQIALRDLPLVVARILRHSLGLSAWKRLGRAHWSLRVNPSSGNLHPTEAYVIGGPIAGLSDRGGVYHYAADRHALERRCAFDGTALAADGDPPLFLVALTSIHWREAWKYGERAFRYCQHDLGHAIAAVRIAAALIDLHARLLPDWSHADIAAVTGLDRDEDYVDAEREEPGCVLAIGRPSADTHGRQPAAGGPEQGVWSRESVLAAVRTGTWTGRASQLSAEHVQWTFIDEIAAATRDDGRSRPAPSALPGAAAPVYPAAVILQRRSAVALDGVSSIPADPFVDMLRRVIPRGDVAPWDAVWWDARIHLALLVHRVDGVEPGLYLLVRNEPAIDRLRAACRRDFLWTPARSDLPLFLLARGDCRALARRISCDQDIAADGFFSLGMIADFDTSLDEFGASFYRHLFWESGVVGQVLYLEAESKSVRGTGIGCFYDDPVHDVLGLEGHAFQSLYHFTIGVAVEDTRLTTEPGYAWEN